MRSITPENLPDQILDAYLEAQIRYPQITTPTLLAVGNVALPMIIEGEYSWSRLATDMMSPEQLDRTAEIIATAHGPIPFRPGPKGRTRMTKEDDIWIFPRERISNIVHTNVRTVGSTVGRMACAVLPKVSVGRSHDFSSVLQQPDCPPSVAIAADILFNAGHQSLAAATPAARAIRRDIHRGYKDVYRKGMTKERKKANAAATATVPNRIDALVIDAVREVMPRVERALGYEVPLNFSHAFFKSAISSEAFNKLIHDLIASPDDPRGRGSA